MKINIKNLIVDIVGFTLIIVILLAVGFNIYNVFKIEKLEKEIEDLKTVRPILIPFIPIEYLEFFSNLLVKYPNVDPIEASSIIQCESEWYYMARNSTSTAKGFFQFINGTWNSTLGQMVIDGILHYTILNYNRLDNTQFNEELNLEAGFYLLNKGEQRHWNASRWCWGK